MQVAGNPVAFLEHREALAVAVDAGEFERQRGLAGEGRGHLQVEAAEGLEWATRAEDEDAQRPPAISGTTIPPVAAASGVSAPSSGPPCAAAPTSTARPVRIASVIRSLSVKTRPRRCSCPGPSTTPTTSPAASGTRIAARQAAVACRARRATSSSASSGSATDSSAVVISALAASQAWRRRVASYRRAFSIAKPTAAASALTRLSSSEVNSPPPRFAPRN